MRPILIFICFMGIVPPLLAQVKISGQVKDGKGRPVPGVSISIKETYDGTSTDSAGKYSFLTTEKGEKIIRLTNLGYNTIEQNVLLGSGSLVVNFIMKDQMNELKAVTITAGAFSAGDSKRGSVLNSLDIATTAGSNADITAALKTLPGAQQVGEQEGLFVRGGTGYETKQFIDGTLVNNPYHTSVPDISQRGRFSPFLFKGTVFSTGGYSALYGEALSSVVLLQSLDIPEKSEWDLTLSPLVVGIGTQQVAKDKNSSFGLTYNYTNVGLYYKLVKQTPDFFYLPQFQDGDANFRFKTKSGGIIKYYTTFGFSRLGLRRPDIDSLYYNDAFSVSNRNWYNNLSYKEYLKQGWKINLGLGYSTNRDDIRQEVQNQENQMVKFDPTVFWMQAKDFSLINKQDLSQGKIVLDKTVGSLSAFRFGGEYQISTNSLLYNDTLHKFTDHLTGLFAETDVFLTNELGMKLGMRVENSSILQKWNWAPRVSLAYKTGQDAQISAAYGIFYQKPENAQIFYTNNLGFTRAIHYLVNYQRISKDYTLRIEAFYKDYADLVKTIPLSYTYLTYDNSGKGYAKGIELFWRDKKTIKDFDYWLSYSYLDTKRNYLNYTAELMPSFAAKHTASLVTKRFFTSIKSGINMTYTYATGRPYYNFLYAGNHYILGDQGFTRSYNSLNLSAEYLPALGKKNPKVFTVLFASVSNVFGANQVYGYNYPYSGNPGLKQAIEPPAKRFLFIGCFLSFGVDRSQDAINNNL